MSPLFQSRTCGTGAAAGSCDKSPSCPPPADDPKPCPTSIEFAVKIAAAGAAFQAAMAAATREAIATGKTAPILKAAKAFQATLRDLVKEAGRCGVLSADDAATARQVLDYAEA